MLARTKSEAALSTGSRLRNPLACLGRDAALQAITEYLSSGSLRCACTAVHASGPGIWTRCTGL